MKDDNNKKTKISASPSFVASSVYTFITSGLTIVVLAIAVISVFIVSASNRTVFSANTVEDESSYFVIEEYKGNEYTSDNFSKGYSAAERTSPTVGMYRLTDENGEEVEYIVQKSAYSLSSYSPMQYGDESERVSTLQNRLIELGFLVADEATEYFGPATRNAVKSFQRQNDLEQNGRATTETLQLLFSEKATYLRLAEGMEGADVTVMQRQLEELCYLEKVTGYYGTLTVEAIKEFQSRNSLPVTGIAARDTLELLYMPNAVPGDNYASMERRRVKIKEFVAIARKQLGKRYSLGSTGPNSFDCSGLVYYCLRAAGSGRHRLSAQGYSQVTDWEKIKSMGDMQIGDLMFFYNDSHSRVGHVGIYIGGGRMIDASTSEGKIMLRSCTTKYWKARFVFARRPW